MPNDPANDGRILQWHHLQANQRRVVSDNLRQVGMSMPERIGGEIDRLAESNAKTAVKDMKTAKAIKDHVRPEPISLQRAANHRQNLYQDAQERNPGKAPEGSDFYFEHNARVAHSARQYGFDPERAHTASAVMSPQNSPENERAAAHAIMHAHAEGEVHVDRRVRNHLMNEGIDVSHHEGQTVPVTDLPRGSLGALSDERVRHSVNTNVDLENVARGGPKDTNIGRAESVLMHESPAGTAQMVNRTGVISGAKVASYDHVIRASKPGSADHVEFMGRVSHDAQVRAGHITPDQGTLDLYGKEGQKVPDDHLLSPRSHTVEDTWQNAITFNQPKELVGEKSKTSVFKAGGSGKQYPVSQIKTRRDPETNKVTERASDDARVSPPMLLHAFNNRATQKAASQQGVPPVAVQGVAWTEARKQAGKSRDQSATSEARAEKTPAQYKTEVDVFHSMGRQVPDHVRELQDTHRPDDNRGQGRLF